MYKFMGATAYLGAWGTIVTGFFRPIPTAVWVFGIVLATIGALYAWGRSDERCGCNAKDNTPERTWADYMI